MLEYVVEQVQARPAARRACRRPTSSSTSSSGSSRRTLPGGAPNPAYDDVNLDGVPDGRVAQREEFIRTAYKEADETLTLARSADGQGPDDVRRLRPRLRPAVPRDRREQAARRPRPAVAAADVELPPGHRRDDRQGEGVLGRRRASRSTSTSRAATRPAAASSRSRRPTSPPRSPRSRRRTWASSTRTTGPTTASPRAGRSSTASSRKAEARYIPNGPGTHRRHGPSDAHRRPRRLRLPAVPVRRRDAGHAGRAVAVLRPARLRARTSRTSPPTSTCGRRSSPAARASPRRRSTARTIDLAPTLAYLLGIPEPQQSQGRVLLEIVKGGNASSRSRSSASTTSTASSSRRRCTFDGINQTVGGAAFLATMFDEELASLPGPGLILAGGDNVGASPPNSLLLEDKPAIDVENAWGLDATSYGNHEFDYGVERLLTQQAAGELPVPRDEHRRDGDRQAPDWVHAVGRVHDQRHPGRRHRRRAARTRPELVSAGATAGPDVPRRGAADQGRVGAAPGAGRQGPGRRHPPGHERRAQPDRQRRRRRRGTGPILDIADALQDTTVDAMIVGHTHRISNLMRGHILDHRGDQRRDELLGAAADGPGRRRRLGRRRDPRREEPRRRASGPTSRRSSTTPTPRPPCCATRSSAPRRTTSPRDPTGSTSRRWATWSPTRCGRSTPASTRPTRTPAACAQDLVFTPPSAGEQPGEITWGEVFAVLPFGNRTTILTLTGAQLRTAFLNGFTPFCDPASPAARAASRRSPGLKVQFHCNGTDARRRRRCGRRRAASAGTLTPIGPADTVRFVTNDFMYTRRRRLHGLRPGHERRPAGRRPAPGHDRLHHRALAGRPGGRGADRRLPVKDGLQAAKTEGPGDRALRISRAILTRS